MPGWLGYETLNNLRAGRVVELDGLRFTMDGDGQVTPGDTYVGARQTVDLYTCRSVNTKEGWVNPQGWGYPFDTHECIKVRETDNLADYVVPASIIAVNVKKANTA